MQKDEDAKKLKITDMEGIEPAAVAQGSRTSTTELGKHTSAHNETWHKNEAREQEAWLIFVTWWLQLPSRPETNTIFLLCM